jgi:hypothetical protein
VPPLRDSICRPAFPGLTSWANECRPFGARFCQLLFFNPSPLNSALLHTAVAYFSDPLPVTSKLLTARCD